MQNITIKTSQNIDIDYEVAGLGDRILAHLLDFSVFLGVYMVFAVVFVSINQGESAGLNVGLVVMIVIWLVLYVLYDLLCEVFFNGQSIGKRALKIKVVSLNGARPTISQYLLRWLFRLIDLGISFGMVAFVSVAISDNRQRIGDLVAGTAMIKTASKPVFNNLYFNSVEPDYLPVYPEVMNLSDKDITLVSDVIRHFNKTRNNVMVYKLAVKLKKYLSISTADKVNEYQFLEIVIKDYSYQASKMEFNIK